MKKRDKKPVVIINFKTYRFGKRVLDLAKSVERVDKKIIVGVQAVDISEVVRKTKLNVYCQHVDACEPGRNTGFITPESVKAVGSKGVFLNHSEHKLDFKILKEIIKRCKDINLKTAVFASDLKEAKQIEKFKPDYLIVEPPELVAGKVSVSEDKPDLIEKIAKNLKSKFLVGAGIHSYNDIKVAMKLGASGIAVSSAITKSLIPEMSLRRLLGR